MRKILVLLVALCASPVVAQNVTTTTITIVTAQQAAEDMARTGILRHCGRAGGRVEGIGMGSSRDHAIRSCCFWGQRQPVEIGVAQGRNGRWYACVRYR